MLLKRFGFVTVLALLVLSAPLFAGGQKEAEGAEEEGGEIHIALTAPITGNYAEYGKNFERSVKLAFDEINNNGGELIDLTEDDSGGVLGKKLVVHVGDSKGDPKESTNLAEKFTSNPEIVAQIGDFTSTCCMAAQPVYDRAGMVQLSPTSSHTNFAPGSEWSFGIVGTQAVEQKYMAEWCYDELDFKEMALLNINNDWGMNTADYFTKYFEEEGGEIVAHEKYFEGEEDFSAVLSKLREQNPEALYIAAMYNDGARIAMQVQKLGWDVTLVGPSSLYSQKLIEIGGDAVNGLHTNVSFFTEDPDPGVQRYVQEFESRYGLKPNFHAALAYDAAYLLAYAIKQAGTTDKSAIRDALAKVSDFPGLTGNITFTDVGDAIKSYKKVVIRDGEFEVVE